MGKAYVCDGCGKTVPGITEDQNFQIMVTAAQHSKERLASFILLNIGLTFLADL